MLYSNVTLGILSVGILSFAQTELLILQKHALMFMSIELSSVTLVYAEAMQYMHQLSVVEIN